MKKKFFKKVFSLALCVGLLFTAIPDAAYSSSKTVAIDLNRKYDFSGKGYSWDYSKQTLTLTDAKLTGTIDLPTQGDVTIILKGENTITAPDGTDNVITRTYNGESVNGTRYGDNESYDILNVGDITIKSSGNGSLSANGNICIYGQGTFTISNCILSVSYKGSTENYPSYRSLHSTPSIEICNKAQLITDGYVYAYALTIDNGTFKNHGYNGFASLSVARNLIIKNNSIFSVRETSGLNPNAPLSVDFDFIADTSSSVEVINTSSSTAVSMGARTHTLSLLSEKLHISGLEEAFFIQTENHGMEVILPDDIQADYHTDLYIQADQWYYTSILDSIGNEAKEIIYISDAAKADQQRIIEGVENTEITLKSSYTAKKNIRLDWKKYPGFRVDYYEVFRSVKKETGYGKTAFFRTDFGLKNHYTNTSTKAGTRYYYRVRGVREINGQLYYTKWSNQAWRIARK